MKTYLDCFPCFLSQALRAARIATDDNRKIKSVLDEVGILLKNIPLESSPPETGRLIYRKVREITGVQDPYREIKDKSTKKTLSLYSSLKTMVEESDDSLLTAVRIAIAGNVIDFGLSRAFDIEKDTYKTLKKEFVICDYDKLKDSLEKADEVLYIGDNAGECVFDKILIEEMRKPVTYVVRNTPVINDATHEDALKAGIDSVATILSSGTDAPGTVLNTCDPVFKNIYKKSGLIISKGQGNYEALSNEKAPVFFLLMVKCPVVAKDIGALEGDIILKG